MNHAESFRDVERVLDDLVRRARQELQAADVSLEDRSARTYHYKNDHLIWAYSFFKEWSVEAERARVTVDLLCSEPATMQGAQKVALSWRAELFQQGDESRIDKRETRSVTLVEIQGQGIADLILRTVIEATRHLPKPSGPSGDSRDLRR